MRETKFWTWHMLSGVVILVLLGIHMVYVHIGELTHFMVFTNNPDSISVENVQARDATSIFPVVFIILLGVALYHGLYGLRTIVFEICSVRSVQKTISAFLIVIGLGLFGLGTWAAIKAHANAKAAVSTQVTALAWERK